MPSQTKEVYTFGPFRLDVDERFLLDSNNPVKLTEKEFALLVAFLRKAGHLLTKEELMNLLWPDTFVEESNLTKQVSNLRKVLGQEETGQRFIETVSKRGFRFVFPVVRLAVESFSAPETMGVLPPLDAIRSASEKVPLWPTLHAGRTIRWSAVAVAALALVSAAYWGLHRAPNAPVHPGQPLLLAVLPLETVDFGDDGRNLGYGITDALITRLSNLENVRLRSSNSVRQYRGQLLDAISIGRELGVDSVLEGTVQRQGDHIRVSVRLVAVREGSPHWAERFDQEFTDLFTVEDSIAERVAASLGTKLTAAEQEQLRRKYTRDPVAYRAYLNGRASLMQSREASLAAIQWFEAALRRDPNFVLARAGLSRASAEMYLRFAREDELDAWAERSEREARAALALEPNLAETHEALAAVYRKMDFNWDATIAESRKALQLNSGLEQPHFYLAAAFYHLGLFDWAAAEARRGADLAPENRVDRLRTDAVIALYSGTYEKAVALLEEVQRLSSRPLSDTHLAQAYYYAGHVEKAEATLKQLLDYPSASASVRAQASLAAILAARGERKRALDLLRTVAQRKYMDHHVAFSLATAHAQLGNNQEAVAWLRKAAEMGLPCYPWFEKDPLLDPIRRHADFRRFMEELRTFWEQARQKYERIA